MYLDLSKVMKPSEKVDRALYLYPRLRFDHLYYSFDERVRNEYELSTVKRGWKEVIWMFHKFNEAVWDLMKFHRTTRSWSPRKIALLHAKVFNLGLMLRELHDNIITLITEEELVWKNYLFIIDAVGDIKLTKDDKRELNPTVKISSIKALLRQMFTPLQNVIDSIEQDILDGKTIEEIDYKLRQLEDSLLLRILPWFYRTFERSVRDV